MIVADVLIAPPYTLAACRGEGAALERVKRIVSGVQCGCWSDRATAWRSQEKAASLGVQCDEYNVVI